MERFTAIRNTLALLMLALCVGCASFQKPETIQDKLGYATATLTASYKTIGALAQRGRITKAEGAKLLSDADGVETSLNATRAALSAGATGDADAALNIGLSALVSLEKSLQEKQR
jgi:hypothetical protein